MAPNKDSLYTLTHSKASGRLHFRSREDAMRAAELLSSVQKPDFGVKVWHDGVCIFDNSDE